MKTTVAFRVDARCAVSLRNAWLMRRACRPMCESPMSPSISAFGTSAATESIDDEIDRARADELVDDLERLLTAVRAARSSSSI